MIYVPGAVPSERVSVEAEPQPQLAVRRRLWTARSTTVAPEARGPLEAAGSILHPRQVTGISTYLHIYISKYLHIYVSYLGCAPDLLLGLDPDPEQAGRHPEAGAAARVREEAGEGPAGA